MKTVYVLLCEYDNEGISINVFETSAQAWEYALQLANEYCAGMSPLYYEEKRALEYEGHRFSVSAHSVVGE